MAKLNITAALAATLTGLLAPVVEGSGKLWDNTRAAYAAALVEFPEPADASKAIRQHITETLKANPGSVKGYLSTLNWLASNGHRDAIGNGIKMGEAEALRYPKPAKPGEDGFMAYAAKRDKDAKARKEQKERDEAANATPRAGLLRQIGQILGDCDEAELSLIAAELVSIVETLRASREEQEVEQEDEAIAA